MCYSGFSLKCPCSEEPKASRTAQAGKDGSALYETGRERVGMP